MATSISDTELSLADLELTGLTIEQVYVLIPFIKEKRED
jgi:hypothetical protein